MGCGAHVTTVATIATVAAKPNCFKANQHHKYTILTVATVATKPNCFKANQHHKYTILRWAQWIVFLIEINLLLPSALYLPTLDPARRPGITPPPYTKHIKYMIIVGSILNEAALPHPPPFPI